MHPGMNTSPIWHPCSQMKDYETFPATPIKKAENSYLMTDTGRTIIDAISSWWCKLLGHNHPRLRQALIEQANKFEHVILANTTNTVIEKLSHRLTKVMPALTKVFYASDGSSAVEIALKMSVHARQVQGELSRTHFATLKNSYHGETIGALSVSDVGIYKRPYHSLLFEPIFIEPLPYVTHQNDPLWHNCESAWQAIEAQLFAFSNTLTAIIIEPIVQGAAGMKIYSQDFLRRLREWTKKHDIHLIADEIMTGPCRTGKLFACNHADIVPDMLCLGKNLTAGWLAFSAVIIHENLYEIFYDDYQTGKSFLHSHTFSGNILAANIANEVLDIITEEDFCHKAEQIGAFMHTEMQKIAMNTGKLCNVRSMGAITAADLVEANEHNRLSHKIFQKAMQLGAFLRPLGATLYWLPPLTISEDTLSELSVITEKAITSV